MSNLCDVCERETDHGCGNCELAYYCSAECQKKDWDEHKNDCTHLKDMTALQLAEERAIASEIAGKPVEDLDNFYLVDAKLGKSGTKRRRAKKRRKRRRRRRERRRERRKDRVVGVIERAKDRRAERREVRRDRRGERRAEKREERRAEKREERRAEKREEMPAPEDEEYE